MSNHGGGSNIMICSCDWQDMLDGQKRVAVAVEALAPILTQLAKTLTQQSDDREAADRLRKNIQEHGKELKEAVEASPKPPAA